MDDDDGGDDDKDDDDKDDDGGDGDDEDDLGWPSEGQVYVVSHEQAWTSKLTSHPL